MPGTINYTNMKTFYEEDCFFFLPKTEKTAQMMPPVSRSVSEIILSIDLKHSDWGDQLK